MGGDGFLGVADLAAGENLPANGFLSPGFQHGDSAEGDAIPAVDADIYRDYRVMA